MARGEAVNDSRTKPDLPKVKITRESLKSIRRLLSYVRPYRLKLIAGFTFLVLTSFTGLAFPGFLGALIDVSQGKHTKYHFLPNSLTQIGLMALAVLFVQALVSYFRTIWFTQVAERSLADIRRDTFFKLITLQMNFFSNRRVGELNSRISADLSQIQGAITSTLAEMLRQSIIVIGGIIILAVISFKLTLAILAVLPVLIVLGKFFGRYTRRLSRETQDKLAESNTVVEETLQGIANVKAFVNEAFEAARYNALLRDVVTLSIKSARFRGLFASFVLFFIFGTISCVVWYGSYLVSISDNGLTFGTLTNFIIYAAFVSSGLSNLPEQYANMQKAIGASERVLEILDETGEDVSIRESDNAIKQKIEGNLEFRNVKFHYPSRDEIEVLKGVSFMAGAGQKVAIVGPSGSGKSTTAALILQFYYPQSGELLFDGKPASEYELTDLRNQVAIVPQDVMLFGGTIRENIAYGKLSSGKAEIIQASKRANAHDFIMGFPEGYDTIVGERGVKLSGGQRQRVAIARALLKDPAILILDEATSSLDSESERLVQEALEELMKNRTSIIIAHRLSTIREADKIIVLEKGVILESGNHDELLKNEQGLYRYLSGLQFELG